MLPDLSYLNVSPSTEIGLCALSSFPFLSIDYERVLRQDSARAGKRSRTGDEDESVSAPLPQHADAHVQWLRLIRLPSCPAPTSASEIVPIDPAEASSLLQEGISPQVVDEDLMVAYEKAAAGLNSSNLEDLSLGRVQIDNSIGGIFYGLLVPPDAKMNAVITAWKELASQNGVLYAAPHSVQAEMVDDDVASMEQEAKVLATRQKSPGLQVEHIVPRSWLRVTKTICQFSSCEHDLLLCYVTTAEANASRSNLPLPFSRRRTWSHVWRGLAGDELFNARGDDGVFPVDQRAFAARVTLYAFLSYPCICQDPETCVSRGYAGGVYGPQFDDMIALAARNPTTWEMRLNAISYRTYGLVNPFVVSTACRNLLSQEDSPIRKLLEERILGTDGSSRAVFAKLREVQGG